MNFSQECVYQSIIDRVHKQSTSGDGNVPWKDIKTEIIDSTAITALNHALYYTRLHSLLLPSMSHMCQSHGGLRRCSESDNVVEGFRSELKDSLLRLSGM